MKDLPFVGIGNDELGDDIGQFVTCPHCSQQHLVKLADKQNPDGTLSPSNLLSFYTCGDKAYLCAVKGKSVMRKFNQESTNAPSSNNS